MKRLYHVSVCVLAMLFVGGGHAREKVYACDYGCSNSQRVAISKSMPYDEGDLISVIDLESGLSNTYRAVKTFTHFGEMIDTVQVTRRSSKATRVSSQYLNLRAEAGVIPLQIPVDYQPISNFRDVTSAIQLISDPQVADWVGTYLTTTQTMRNRLAAFVNDIANLGIVIATGTKMESNILVRFNNGSTALFATKYTFENGITIQDIEYVDGSARFADGSKIPNHVAQLVGNWRFEHNGDLDGFIRLGALWGVSFSSTGNSDDEDCEAEKTNCTTLPDGTYECTIRYICN